VVSSTPQPHFTPGKDPVPIVQEAGWAPEPVWTGGKSRPAGIRSPDRSVCSQSLYRLSYLAPLYIYTLNMTSKVILINFTKVTDIRVKQTGQPLHVSGVCMPIIRRYNRIYTAFGTYYSLQFQSIHDNIQSSKKNNKYQMLYTYGCTS
jgi:hypothetical protein